MPEKPGESLLLDRVSEPDPKLRMPPEGEPLTAGEIETLSRWISAGADSPPDETPQTDPREHWAFRKPVRTAVPRVRSTGNGNPVDAFLLQPLEAQGIEPLPEAGRLVLLRRVTLDLTGLPPTRGEQQAFLADDSPDAYEKVVDRLLDSPQYGERWGRHWMDVWRYSDWYGRRAVPDVMNSYPQIWRWRDWIVRSLNSDKGYDQMVQEMLAADEIAPSDEENVVATGFLVRNWFKWNYETWMKDNVEHTGKAFLGLTLNCCHCHDHKYDPLTHEEYFRFRAFFEPLELRHDRVPGVPDPGPFKKYIYGQSYGPIAHGRIRVFDEKLDAQTFMYANGDARNRLPNKPPVEPGVPAILGNAGFTITPVALPPDAFYPGMKPQLRAEDVQKAQTEVAAADALLKQSEAARAPSFGPLEPGEPVEWVVAEGAVGYEEAVREMEARVAADDRKYRDGSSAGELAQAASLTERRAAFDAAQLQLARAERGLVAAERKAAADEKAQPEVVAAVQQLTAARTAVDAARAALAKTSDSYTPLSPLYPARSTGRRAALARWIVSRDNPLAARVAVNHIWLRHFGRALVESTANFGRQGRLPSHPQLLDWLAVELMENGWRMKPLHRLLVTSQAYRRQSHLGASTHPNLAADRDNRLYWRFNPQRMQAEVVRDSVLCCAEELDPTLGGQELDHVQGLTSKRRSLYFAIHGEAKMQFLDLFDGPSVVDCYQRSSS
ncbi:MAG: DUF1549 domain-containing protein, partial [Planctomycetota bacterium]|nr:DUF1549 domain-containing protein [Planctomycetota bacterium]